MNVIDGLREGLPALVVTRSWGFQAQRALCLACPLGFALASGRWGAKVGEGGERSPKRQHSRSWSQAAWLTLLLHHCEPCDFGLVASVSLCIKWAHK